MKEVNLKDKENCCGCTACYSTCPVHAIVMEEDEEGFLHPKINKEICVLCRKCEKVCNLTYEEKKCEALKYFAVKNNDDIRNKSSSGGIFSALANYVEKNDGVIYGACFESDFSVMHKRAENFTEWNNFRGAKYIQSKLCDTFKEVKEDLKKNRKVLFTGTPCQIDGLKKFLNNVDTTNLITCDIVCHGVPSPKIWQEYLKYVRKKYKNEIGKVNFRNKKGCGWHCSTVTIEDCNGKEVLKERHNKNIFCLLYFCHFILRQSCYRCKYSNFNRVGDITIGDFWGIEKKYPEFDDDKGVSLVFINSIKGLEIWEKMKSQFSYIEMNKEDCFQPNLLAPSKCPHNRNVFWEKYKKYGFEFSAKRVNCMDKNFIDKIIIFIDKVIDKLKHICHEKVK